MLAYMGLPGPMLLLLLQALGELHLFFGASLFTFFFVFAMLES